MPIIWVGRLADKRRKRDMAKQPLVTLLTDFGTADPYVAAMKGVILSACPTATIVDISHDVPPHDVLAAAIVLAQAAPYFPPDTLHMVVVDPGVGTGRRILAGSFGRQRFLLPDNGVIGFVAAALPVESLVVVREAEQLRQAAASMTFHGRDIFAPLAGRILNGLAISKLGPPAGSYKAIELPAPREDAGRVAGQVIYVDRFGNLISNISAELVSRRWHSPAGVRVGCGNQQAIPFRLTYAQAAEGEALALFDSMGLLEVAVNRDRACDVLAAGVGSEVMVVEAPGESR